MTSVIIVGGTGGIGRALAAGYLAAGWEVGITGRRVEQLRETVATLSSQNPGSRCIGVPADVSRPDDLLAALDKLARTWTSLDLLIYAAGTMPPESGWSELTQAATLGIPVNLTGATISLSWGASLMERQGRGRLVVIGSVAGDRGRRGAPVYGAAKAGIHAFADGLRHRLHGTGVGVTTIRPGWVATSMLPAEKHRSPMTVTPERAARRIIDGIARGRDVLYVPGAWRAVGLVLKALPSFLHKRFAPP